MADNKSIYDIVQGIYQAAANTTHEHAENPFDDDKGDKAGEIGKNQGFFVKINANKMLVTYECNMSAKDSLDKTKVENEQKQYISKIESFLKKEYKKITGKTLSISKDGDPDILIQSTHSLRVFIITKQMYTISGIPEISDEGAEEAVKTFNSLDTTTVLKESWSRYLNDKN